MQWTQNYSYKEKRVGISTIGILLHNKRIDIVIDIAPDEVEFVFEFNEKSIIEGNFEKSIHAPHHYVNISALDNDALKFSKNEIRKTLQFGLPVVVHEGRNITNFNGWKSESLKRMEETLLEFSESSTILLENVTPSSYFKNIKEFFEFVSHFDNLFVCLDIPHVFANEGTLENLFAIKDKYKERILKIHISDTVEGKDLHLPLGEGVLPLNEVKSFLKEFSVPLINEAVKRDDIDMVSFYKREIEKTRQIYE